MAWQARVASPRQGAGRRGAGRPDAGRRARPDALVCLVSRLLVAQAGASAAIGLGYSRQHVPWLVLTIVAAIALCGLAGLARTSASTLESWSISRPSGAFQ